MEYMAALCSVVFLITGFVVGTANVEMAQILFIASAFGAVVSIVSEFVELDVDRRELRLRKKSGGL